MGLFRHQSTAEKSAKRANHNVKNSLYHLLSGHVSKDYDHHDHHDRHVPAHYKMKGDNTWKSVDRLSDREHYDHHEHHDRHVPAHHRMTIDSGNHENQSIVQKVTQSVKQTLHIAPKPAQSPTHLTQKDIAKKTNPHEQNTKAENKTRRSSSFRHAKDLDKPVDAFDIQIEKRQFSVGKTKFCANFGF